MKRIGLGLSLAALGVGCGGGRSYIKADTAAYVVSMSDAVRAADGSLVLKRQAQQVGAFEVKYTAWSMLWMTIPLSNEEYDLSPAINSQVAKAGGDAVVDLRTRVTNCGLSRINLLGLLPDCSEIEVRGDIIKVGASASPPISAVAR